jgi:hypothetical protein
LREFPVVFQQSVEAGKTPVGTQVKGKLLVATRFHGTLIPRNNAVVSGVIFESVRKTATARPDLELVWKMRCGRSKSTCMMKAYLMPLYYPMTTQPVEALPIDSPDHDTRTLDGPNQSVSSPMSQRPFSGSNSEMGQAAIPEIPGMSIRPVAMKNVAFAEVADGGIDLVSEHVNIKLYRMMIYVLAAIEPPAK